MNQIEWNDNILKLKVRKSPLIIRTILSILSFVFFVLPTLGMILAVSDGGGLHFGFFFGIGVFGFLGFYLLRIVLWNTHGEELICIMTDHLTYEASYGWFKDAKKTILLEGIKFSFSLIGYEEDQEGSLSIVGGEIKVHCVTKMRKADVESCIIKLESRLAEFR
jgi:hypothetical protein